MKIVMKKPDPMKTMAFLGGKDQKTMEMEKLQKDMKPKKIQKAMKIRK